MPAFSRTNLKGRVFGHWTVVSYDDEATRAAQRKYKKKKSRSITPAMWHCVCRCGTIKSVRCHTLITGGSKSCGCLRAAQRTQAAKKRRAVRKKAEKDFC